MIRRNWILNITSFFVFTNYNKKTMSTLAKLWYIYFHFSWSIGYGSLDIDEFSFLNINIKFSNFCDSGNQEFYLGTIRQWIMNILLCYYVIIMLRFIISYNKSYTLFSRLICLQHFLYYKFGWVFEKSFSYVPVVMRMFLLQWIYHIQTWHRSKRYQNNVAQ